MPERGTMRQNKNAVLKKQPTSNTRTSAWRRYVKMHILRGIAESPIVESCPDDQPYRIAFCEAFITRTEFNTLYVVPSSTHSIIMTSRKTYRTPTKLTVRSACDRCHETKNRCARAMGSFECERCSRLGNVCAYSAPLPMGRPKDKTPVESSSPTLKENRHAYSHRTQTERKRQKRTTQTGRASVKCSDNNYILTSPPLSTSNVSNSIIPGISVEDPQNSISDSWLPVNWSSGEFDLDCMMQSDFTPPPDISVPFQGTALSQMQDTDFSELPSPDSIIPTGGEWVVHQPIDGNVDPANGIEGTEPRCPSESFEGCLQQLSRIQLDLCQLNLHTSVSIDGSQILSEARAPPRHSPALGMAGMSSLDIILATTQALIDVLQNAPTSSSMAFQSDGSFKTSNTSKDSIRYNELSPSSQGDGQPCSLLAENCAKVSDSNPNHGLDIATTLLSLSCYATLLVAYESLVASLVSSLANQNSKSTMQVSSTSLSLNFGKFSMVANSTLFVSTVLHVVRQMLEQLQSTFRARYSLPNNVTPNGTTPTSGDSHSPDQDTVECSSFGTMDQVTSPAYNVLVGISERGKKLMEILASKQ